MFPVETKQLTLNFEPGMTEAYPTCLEFVSYRIHHQRKPVKIIAADMDYSPSDLSRKLAQYDNDSSRFTLDDLEKYMAVTGDADPVLYLVEKYLSKDDPDELKRKIIELEAKLSKAI